MRGQNAIDISILLVALLAASCDTSERASEPPPAVPSRVERIDAALTRAAAFVRSRQGPDGAFRSRHYAAFRDGYSLTPMALLALRMAPSVDERGYRRGVDFVASLVQDAAVRADAAAPSYPLYAIAGALLVLNIDENRRHDAQRTTLVSALRARQLQESHGYAPDDLSYGGFSYSDELPRAPAPQAPATRENSANLSATLFALGALRLSSSGQHEAVFARARGFVERCQNWPGDGGFFFSPALADGNKAGAAKAGFRSYGSMTADGLRALLVLGDGPTSPRAKAAAAWLDHNFNPRENPGAFAPQQRVRSASARYYYAWSLAHILRALNDPQAKAAALAEALLAEQDSDGAFRNAYTEMREDDPLVATPFAAAALALTRALLTGEPRSHRRMRP